jgi:hypothetical protein
MFNSGNYSGIAAAATSSSKPLLLTTTATTASANSNTINGYTVADTYANDSDDDNDIPSWAGVVSGGTSTTTANSSTIKPLTATAKQHKGARSDSGMHHAIQYTSDYTVSLVCMYSVMYNVA